MPKGASIGGYGVGIICIDAWYPMLPGNVVNATTYTFPVFCHVLRGVSFPQIAAAEPSVLDRIIEAGQGLIQQGARAIVGACGSFANYQRDAAAALEVPTFLSIMMQVPLIARALKPSQKVGVICSAEGVITTRVLDQVGLEDPSCMVLREVAGLSEFSNILESTGHLNSARLEKQLVVLIRDFVREHPEIGAILLQCSDLPPYAAAIQRATGLAVFDMTTLVEWVYRSVVRLQFSGLL